MKIAEKATLCDYIDSVDLICEKFEDARNFYEHLDKVPDFSLQSTAYKSDMNFLQEVNKVLSIIVSIIAHPHIANKREDIIIRIEQAPQIQTDAFKRVLQDSSLWKNHKGKMLPEKVHHHQYVDQLKIYENQFIVLLVDLLDVELSKSNAFYLQKLPDVAPGDNVFVKPLHSSISQEDSAVAIKLTENLKRKLRYIKNSFFYKVVSEGKGISGVIKPTNILLKDRLYRACYRFYLSFVRYQTDEALRQDLAKYASVMILKCFKKAGFKLNAITEGKFRVPEGLIRKLLKRGENTFNGVFVDNDESGEIFVNRTIAPFFNGATFVFENDYFLAECSYLAENSAISLQVKLKNNNTVTSHVLLFDNGEKDIAFTSLSDFTSCELFSIWNSYAVEGEQVRLLKGDFNEIEMIDNWILSKFTVITGDKDIYSRYCPVCKAQSVSQDESGVCSCALCSTEYFAIDENDDSDIVKFWLSKVRRV